MALRPTDKYVAQNRKARHDYFIDESLEVGMVLFGTEVKTLRAGTASIQEAYAREERGELYLLNAYIPEYQMAGIKFNHQPRRQRKLLLKRKELNRLMGLIKREGVTLVPLSIYFIRAARRSWNSASRGARRKPTSARPRKIAIGSAIRPASCGRRAGNSPRPSSSWPRIVQFFRSFINRC